MLTALSFISYPRLPLASTTPAPTVAKKGTDFYMTSLNAQALIDEWNNGMNLVDILEILLPQVGHTHVSMLRSREKSLLNNVYHTSTAERMLMLTVHSFSCKHRLPTPATLVAQL